MTAEPRRQPRILVTGFGGFPGVPANPTAALIDALRARPDALRSSGHVALDVLDVDYRSLPARLESLGRDVAPDIAIHFGVSGRAAAFHMERVAKNAVYTDRPDCTGFQPPNGCIREGADAVLTSLPSERLVATLRRNDLPAELSEDAGDYLCNYLFFLAGGGHCPGFAPAMAGFIHVPPFGAPVGEGRSFDLEMLVQGALIVVETCAGAWREALPHKEKAAPESAA